MENSYLMKIDDKVLERPQHMWMRVSIGIHADLHGDPVTSLRRIKETYDLMSQKYFTHAKVYNVALLLKVKISFY